MNFRKQAIKKSKQQENNISVIRNTNGTGSIIAKVLFVWVVIIGLAFVTNEQLKSKTTDDSLASVDVTTSLTTSIVTTNETTTSTSIVTTATKKEIVKVTVLATSVSVPATEQTTTTTEIVVTEPEPVHEEPQIVEDIVPEPEPIYEEPEVHEEVVQEEPQPVEEPVVENNNNQQYYSDDGDHGWSYVSYRYGLPDISADRERYHAALDYVSEEERIYLINVVTSEYGSDYVPLYEKAKVVAVVMNRLHNGYWGDSISSVLAYPGQFVGYYLKDGFYSNTTPECIDAVDYYFLHKDDSMYSGIMYISGGGGWNSFY